MLFVAKNILLQGLRYRKASQALSGNLIHGLEQLVAADEDNFQARGPLRVLRIVQVLGVDFAGTQLAIMCAHVSECSAWISHPAKRRRWRRSDCGAGLATIHPLRC